MSPKLLAELDAFDKEKMTPEVREWVKERAAMPADKETCRKIANWLLAHNMPDHFVHAMNAARLKALDAFSGVPHVAATIIRCPDLKHLCLESVEIDDAAAGSLAWALERITTLTSFHMNCCRISEQGITTLAMSFKQNRSVKELAFEDFQDTVEGHPLPPEWVCTLAVALTANTALEDLSFDDVHLDAPSVKALSTMLVENKRVSKLRVENPTFPRWLGAAATVCLPLMNILRTNACGLQTLELTTFTFASDADKTEWYGGLASMLPLNKTLFFLNLANNEPDESHVAQIAAGIEGATTLESLDLSENDFTPADIDTLLMSLEKNVSLKYLALSGPTTEQRIRMERHLVANRSRVAMLLGAGGALGPQIEVPHFLPREVGALVGGFMGTQGTAAEMRSAYALVGVNKQTHAAAIDARSDFWRDALTELLGDVEGLLELGCELRAAGVTLLPEHMERLVADAAGQDALTTLIEALAASGMLSVDDALVIAVQHTDREAIKTLSSRITDVGMVRVQSLRAYADVADLFADQSPPTQ